MFKKGADEESGSSIFKKTVDKKSEPGIFKKGADKKSVWGVSDPLKRKFLAGLSIGIVIGIPIGRWLATLS
ncbi:hypothetical protein [Lysobacter capsici]|uniref:hypothetical protein n=1 Tax=Lysobacter capsici TaxID=435897 RepID=UPI00287B7475|nr:hypothetical protein [Lysobacter capsici]WND79820.1 hypothetical protein RJ610_21425 [Lysobacter capsici]WND85016.1 hypothetical protein RJ609_21440 [Lysobacter capsici]